MGEQQWAGVKGLLNPSPLRTPPQSWLHDHGGLHLVCTTAATALHPRAGCITPWGLHLV